VYSQNPLPAALFCHLAGIPLRLAHCRENPYHLLTDWVPEREPDEIVRHEVRRQLDLVGTVGAVTREERMRLAVPEDAVMRVRQLLEGSGLSLERPWAVFHPGATAASRMYPAEMFADAARTLALEHGWQVVFSGVEAERELVESVRGMMGAASVSMAGQLSVEEVAALLRLAPVLISNNTGVVHLAAGVGTAVVDLYALTNPQHTPWGVPQRTLSYGVPCAYCYKSVCPEGHHLCLRGVTPDSVVQAALEVAAEVLPTVVSEGYR
jgi:lipopolysaccharide heptosyltransferase II